MPEFAYEKLASDLASQIRGGTLRSGERIPSVREMSRKHRVSVTTVLQSYRRLEAQRLVEARPQSGFYVLPQAGVPIPYPDPPAPPSGPTSVSTSEMIREIIRASSDPDAVPLGAALPDPVLLPVAALNRSMAAALRRDEARGASFTSPLGALELRREIAKREWNGGRSAEHEDVVVTCGATEAISLALQATTQPGDVVAVESPTFFGVLQSIEALGRQAIEIPTCPLEGMDVDALECAIRSHRISACVVTPNIQNPLGAQMPDSRKVRLVELLSAHEIPVIEDDTFGELSFDGQQQRSLRVWDEDDLVIRCGSFGKTLAPGYRVGWIVPGPRYSAAVLRYKLASTVNPATPSQLAIAHYLATGGYDHHLRRLRRTLRDNVARLTGEIAARFPDGIELSRPKGGFLLWVRLLEHTDALILHEDARRAGISISPGPIFSASGGFRNFVRLSAGHLWSERTEEALDRLADSVRRQAGKAPGVTFTSYE